MRLLSTCTVLPVVIFSFSSSWFRSSIFATYLRNVAAVRGTPRAWVGVDGGGGHSLLVLDLQLVEIDVV